MLITRRLIRRSMSFTAGTSSKMWEWTSIFRSCSKPGGVLPVGPCDAGRAAPARAIERAANRMRRAIENPPGGLSIRTPLRVNMADKEARGVKYILLIYGDEREWTSMSQEELAKVYEQHGAYGEAMVKAGVMR